MAILYIICFIGVVLLSFVLVASERDLRARRANPIHEAYGEYPETPVRMKTRIRQNYRRRMQSLENAPTKVVEFTQQKRA